MVSFSTHLWIEVVRNCHTLHKRPWLQLDRCLDRHLPFRTINLHLAPFVNGQTGNALHISFVTNQVLSFKLIHDITIIIRNAQDSLIIDGDG